ncbi:MAG: FUSC family protein [Rhodopseudomonas sp.]|nr:FUSC family protein [Rhodopseudomonas sp.]
MTLTDRLTAWGLDKGRLTFGLRTAFAACLALLAAWLIGLEHPQWSAMTVWAASQPLRGQLIEKSLFRALGTMVGVTVGVALVVVAADRLFIVVIGLSLWIGFCAGLGNIQRGFLAYGSMLTGYSAAMVALLDTRHPDHIIALGLDRLATVLVGVVTALLIGLLLTPKHGEQPLAERVRRLTTRVLDDMTRRLGGKPANIAEEQNIILSEMAAIEDTLDPHSAGSLRSRRTVRAIRALLTAQVAALLWLRGAIAITTDSDASAALGDAARKLAMPTRDASQRQQLDQAAIADVERAADLATSPALRAVIRPIETALRDQLGLIASDAERPQTHHLVILHRDWVGAREAFIRAAGSLMAVGALWLVTGLNEGAFLMLGLAIMTSIFSTFDNPARMMPFVFTGQALGAAVALACTWLIWPSAGSGLAMVLLVMPFVFAGALLFAHRRTTAISFDYNMVLLLLLHPAFPLSGSFDASLYAALAVVAGPAVAYFVYRLIFPATEGRRMNTLIAMMVRELENMAGTDNAKSRQVWRARLYHRLLRLVRWAEKTGDKKFLVVNGSLAVLQVGSAVLHIQDLLRRGGIGVGGKRALTAVLRRIRHIGRQPERAGRALMLAAARLKRDGCTETEPIESAALALVGCSDFLHRATA